MGLWLEEEGNGVQGWGPRYARVSHAFAAWPLNTSLKEDRPSFRRGTWGSKSLCHFSQTTQPVNHEPV